MFFRGGDLSLRGLHATMGGRFHLTYYMLTRRYHCSFDVDLFNSPDFLLYNTIEQFRFGLILDYSFDFFFCCRICFQFKF